MQKILLYYKFTPIKDTVAIKLWQKALCDGLNLRGRILISPHGLNGTVGGEMDDLKRYIKATKEYPGFKGTVFKWSDGSRDDFPKLSVKVRDEVVAFRATDELRVDETGVVGGGKHLKPRDVHKLVEEKGDDVVFFDGRNAHEAAIGKFKNAVVPDTHTTHDFINELESGKYDSLKDRPVVTYCTGGIRCEILSSLMINRGFKEVYQMDGGIVKYGEAYGDDGLWEGSLRVFDNRMTIDFSDHAKTIGKCSHCDGPTNNYENCAYANCNDLVLICLKCKQNPDLLYHTETCRQSAELGATV
ncbi:MAG TPA: rhodanese-related sulfurtransferase [Candidatus Saccharibacteria bacterium]|nr:rhodanese-related sulfurtransferase [Candidatus Saccharibacteria bacterium]HRQ97944.1 rhodanese-related sulfurtransferase [Candidatus Saccharibacteria bacterium]